MKIFKTLLLACAIALCASPGHASETADSAAAPVRPVLSAYTAEVGKAHLADTYLTPLFYDGWHVGLGYERMQAMKFDPRRWVMQLSADVVADHTQNRGHNSVMWNLEANVRWGMMRRWADCFAVDGLTLGIGPATEVRAGALYLSRNGNNPASAKGAWTVNAQGYAAYGMRIGRLPVCFRYECSLPVTGIFFAPQYGELYYEIWLGDRSGLVRGAWWGNYFRMDNRLTADLRFGGTALRLGYHADVISTKASGVVSRRVTHAFTIGVTTEWISLSPRRKADSQAEIISALYSY